jgi:hypothetical protein
VSARFERSRCSRMLCPVCPVTPLTPATVHLNKVPRRMSQVVISAFQLLQVLGIDQPHPPQVFKEPEVWPRCPQRLAPHGMFVCQMMHAHTPRMSAQITCHFPITQRALNRLRWFLAAEVR